MIHVITSFYLAKTIERNNELQRCLIKNLKSKYVSKVHLFVDNEEAEQLAKKIATELKKELTIVEVGKQPLYSDLFEYANTLTGKICMICNSDIYLLRLHGFHIKQIYCLTRHEWDGSTPLIDNFQMSHDGFMFMSPLDKLDTGKLAHKQNIMGSENVVIYELNQAKYDLKNPCKKCVIVHEHGSEQRSYDQKKTLLATHFSWRHNTHLYGVWPDHLPKKEIKTNLHGILNATFRNFR